MLDKKGIIIAVVVSAAIIGFLYWLFKTEETVAHVTEVKWEHHVRLLEDFSETTCGINLDGEYECETDSWTKEYQHEVHQGTNGLDGVTWPTVRVPVGRQYVRKQFYYKVGFHRGGKLWTYSASSIPDAKRFKPGKMWLVKVNKAGMIFPERETGAEG